MDRPNGGRKVDYRRGEDGGVKKKTMNATNQRRGGFEGA